MRTYYDVLGVGRDASPGEIKRAYHQLALHYHPDKNQSAEAAEKMRQLNEAYQTLSDPVARERYDAALRSPSPGYQTYRSTGYSGNTWADYGYEAPRHTNVYHHTVYFSFENLVAAAITGATIGAIIAVAFVFLGIRLDTRPGLVAALMLAAVATFAPPVLTVIQLRKSIGSDGEARMAGAIALAATLSIAVAGATIFTAIFGEPGLGLNPVCGCCGLAPAMAVAGWVIGGRVGKITRNIFPI
ncbi:J domain-containing protein [Methanocella arvoryzae]|uniref:J domain-containing protein n=1 Tax=Methanocella arvoryzae (strain DSM 22066 / NBRC 105507 / MRE50) TaxID=351160 RepID=Q0W599_METAR|nr:J domain-containing protein [Methanocella arvoryzae]CAJ36444.1 predicted protein interacting with DnaK (DnaJ-like) [Methanocella arvoryzae MRE50]